MAAALGPHPLLVDALHARLLEAGWPPAPGAAARARAGVVLAAAGSRDPDSAADTGRTAVLLAERLGVPVVPAYASAAAPTVPEAVRALAARGRRRIALASYFTAPGRFHAESAGAAPGSPPPHWAPTRRWPASSCTATRRPASTRRPARAPRPRPGPAPAPCSPSDLRRHARPRIPPATDSVIRKDSLSTLHWCQSAAVPTVDRETARTTEGARAWTSVHVRRRGGPW